MHDSISLAELIEGLQKYVERINEIDRHLDVGDLIFIDGRPMVCTAKSFIGDYAFTDPSDSSTRVITIDELSSAKKIYHRNEPRTESSDV